MEKFFDMIYTCVLKIIATQKIGLQFIAAGQGYLGGLLRIQLSPLFIHFHKRKFERLPFLDS